jgi:hypothetical protein
MYYYSPVSGKQYYLRLLLTVIRGPRSFADLYLVEGVRYLTGTRTGASKESAVMARVGRAGRAGRAGAAAGAAGAGASAGAGVVVVVVLKLELQLQLGLVLVLLE